MEFGDILYVILILVFIVFGFFKDLSKKKRDNLEKADPADKSLGDVFKEVFTQLERPQNPPPVPAPAKKEEKKRSATAFSAPASIDSEFQSSMDLIMDFESESSLSDYVFPDYDLDSPSVKKQKKRGDHPILEDLTGDNKESEFLKAIIYSEILNRRY